MFDSLLIANRGEVALRIVRSARALGLRTIAVYSDADTDAEHVRHADAAVRIGGPLPAQSYLRIDAIVDAALASRARAVHPGYGFLAENADFAAACAAAGLVFVGPSPEAIRAMGDKAGAKRRLQAAGVPCIPGYEGEDQGDARLAAEAARIGWPVMIKATAGGGGRGMRRVDAAQDFAALLASARSEARHAFGNGTVILERALVAPRHVEIQVLADRHGHIIHLGERDCSVQRRHQKVIEEAPSPAVDAALRESMGATAVAAARAIGYEGAGTLEFLLDAEGRYYFMEMNTRLQVEHPVTEAITGLDLVALQLRIAAGERLPLAQEDVRFDGHAIEVRLCAEDPAAGFVPDSGALVQWRPAPGLRTEHALRPGIAVPPFYDPMIAKLVAHGATREEARRRLLRGLQETQALGIRTNQHFLQRCLVQPAFVRGQATTAFVADHLDALLAPEGDADAVALAAFALQAAGRGMPSPLVHGLACPLRLELDGQLHEARLTPRRDARWRVQVGDRLWHIALLASRDDELRLAWEDEAGGATQQETVHVAREPGTEALLLHARGRAWRVEDHSRRSAVSGAAAVGDGLLRASTTGRVVAVLAAQGDTVAAGQALIVLEAMKMEHLHGAPRAGRLRALQVRVGDQVAARQVLAEVDDAPAEEG
ncbi:MAG: biotin carboxylase N-terminal domain-containing protein [Rhodocyclaceae bacterium]|nr:biotin carboxylase N-terminal domain-containing protein [Rhodocyclaceae bacterium]